jgi:hypothetical protein
LCSVLVNCAAHTTVTTGSAIEVDDVDALHAELAGRGASCSAPKDQPYGMREIILTTIDGHRFVFGQQTG